MGDRERLDDFARRLRAAEVKHREKLRSFYQRQIRDHLRLAFAEGQGGSKKPVTVALTYDLSDGLWRVA